MSSQSLSNSSPLEQHVPLNVDLLQNSSLVSGENQTFATDMGPQETLFVAKLSAADESTQFPSERLTALLERVHAGGMHEYLGVTVGVPETKESGKMGRPAALNERLKNKICMLLALGYTRSLAAAELRVARSTITRTMQRDKAFSNEVLRAEELYERNPLLTIMDAARRNWRAAAWLLKNHKPHSSVIRRKRRQKNQDSAADAKDFFESHRKK